MEFLSLQAAAAIGGVCDLALALPMLPMQEALARGSALRRDRRLDREW